MREALSDDLEGDGGGGGSSRHDDCLNKRIVDHKIARRPSGPSRLRHGLLPLRHMGSRGEALANRREDDLDAAVERSRLIGEGWLGARRNEAVAYGGNTAHVAGERAPRTAVVDECCASDRR